MECYRMNVTDVVLQMECYNVLVMTCAVIKTVHVMKNQICLFVR